MVGVAIREPRHDAAALDLAGLAAHHNHGRQSHNQDEGVVVLARPVTIVWRQLVACRGEAVTSHRMSLRLVERSCSHARAACRASTASPRSSTSNELTATGHQPRLLRTLDQIYW